MLTNLRGFEAHILISSTHQTPAKSEHPCLALGETPMASPLSSLPLTTLEQIEKTIEADGWARENSSVIMDVATQTPKSTHLLKFGRWKQLPILQPLPPYPQVAISLAIHASQVFEEAVVS